MRRAKIALVVCLSLLVASAAGWAKGRTIRIVIEGDGLTAPLEITDRRILDQFNIWNGPGVRTSINGIVQPPAYLDRKQSAGRFIDWPRGTVAAKPTGLQRLEVAFYIGVTDRPDEAPKYVVAYEIDSLAKRGYIYLPRWKNSLISHGVEGNWFHASGQWDEVVIPIIAEHSSEQPRRKHLNCTVGRGTVSGDGTIEFALLDEHGNELSHWRYDSSVPGHQSVKNHIGPVEQGTEFDISCWPPRS